LTENNAKLVGILSRGNVEASYIATRLGDILDGKKTTKDCEKGANRIFEKLREAEKD
jgi:hypothetical protein